MRVVLILILILILVVVAGGGVVVVVIAMSVRQEGGGRGGVVVEVGVVFRGGQEVVARCIEAVLRARCRVSSRQFVLTVVSVVESPRGRIPTLHPTAALMR